MERALRIPFRPLARAVRQRLVVRRHAGPFVRTPTPADRLGPAYRRGAPFRACLRDASTAGEPLLLEGQVVSAHTGGPIPAVTLDVWQTDARGLYSDLLGLARRGDPAGMALRGRLASDDAGAYRLETVVPGPYPLGPLSRPCHIHFRLTHPEYAPLVTQLYFEGDPLLHRDRFATPALRLVLSSCHGPDGQPTCYARFDFVLVRA